MNIPNINSLNLLEPVHNQVDLAKCTLKHLLFLNNGEIYGRPNMGCNLYQLLYQTINVSSIQTYIQEQLNYNVKLFANWIKITKIFVYASDIEENTLYIQINFYVNNDNANINELVLNWKSVF